MKATANVCQKCGVALPPDSRRAFCARCLFRQAVAMPGTEMDEDAETEAAPSPQPASGFPMAVDSAEPKAGKPFGDYELLEELGRGGMGIVYRARQTGIGRQVAVKLLRFGPMAGEEFVKRLRMEATAAGCLRHPNIVAIHEVGIHHDQHYLAMDYVAGPNLATLAGNHPLAVRRAVSLVKTVAEAIHYAHERGILHRDLKPSNILIEEDDQPRITDFGLAKRLESAEAVSGLDLLASMTLTGQVLGSPNYMPPEQASADRGKTGRPSDVYSLGAILYHLITGRPPFVGDTLTATLHQVLEADPAAPGLLNPVVPADLETICLKCLEKEPERRYATARELAEELGRFLAGDPILARPISGGQRVWRWCRKNPLFATAVGAALGLLLVVAIGSPIAAYRIERARQEIKRAGERAVRDEAAARRQLYAANLNLAQSAWEANHHTRLADLLAETGQFPGRGFEWYFWQNQAHQSLTVLRGHTAGVTAAKFSPDGRWVLTASEDQTCVVWEAAGRQTLMTLRGHAARVRGAAWFPDNQRVATGSDDHTAKVWDTTTGAELMSLQPRRGRVLSVAVSPDGEWIATANQDGTATLWPANGGREIRVLQGHTLHIFSVAFSLDGRSLVTSSADQTVRVWDRESGRGLAVIEDRGRYVYSAAFSPDGRRILTASDDRTAKVWDAATGQRLLVLAGHNAEVLSAAFAPDGSRIATASSDWTVKLWDGAEGRELMTLNGHVNQVNSVAFAPDSRWLISGAKDTVARVWDLGHELKRLRLPTPGGPVFAITFSRDGEVLLTGGEDGAARVFDAATGRQLQVLKGQPAPVRSAVFSPDHRRIATASADGVAKVWELATGREAFSLRDPAGAIGAIAFSPDGHSVVTGNHLGIAIIWDAATGQDRLTLNGHRDSACAVAFSADGQRVVTASWDGHIKIWDAVTGQERLDLVDHGGSIMAMALSPDGRRLVSGCSDHSAKVWDLETGRELLAFRAHAGVVTSVAFSPDGQRIVSGSEGRTAELWDATSGAQLLTLHGDGATVLSVAFAPDGRRVAVGSEDGTITIWDAATPGQVAAWEQQETGARQRVAGLDQERKEALQKRRALRASDPGAVRDWLLLCPVNFATGQDSLQALHHEFLPSEGELRPRAGDQARVGRQELVWRPVHLADHAIDFVEQAGRVAERAMAYAVCYLEAEAPQTGLRLLVGSDDQSRIYLNGRQLYQTFFKRGFVEDEDVVTGVRLEAGVNVLVFKVVNLNANWKGSVLLTDAEGGQVKGIKVRVNP